MMTNTNTAAIESLRIFADSQIRMFEAWEHKRDTVIHLTHFVHLCTAALAGEEWAIERLSGVLVWTAETASQAAQSLCQSSSVEARMLNIIRSTDTRRPDGAIARSIEI